MSKRLKITSFSSPFLFTVEEDTTILEVIELMKDAKIRHVPVVNKGKVTGIISERDLKVFEDRAFAEEFSARDVMIPQPFAVSEDTDLRYVVSQMAEKKYGACLVQDQDEKIVGIFTTIDALRTLNILLENQDFKIETYIDG